MRSGTDPKKDDEDTHNWNFEGLRHMGVTKDYKDDSPNGYKEHLTYTDGDEKINTPEDKITEFKDIKKKAKDLSAQSEHKDILYPNITAKAEEADKKKDEEEEKAKNKTVFKSNETGEAPPVPKNKTEVDEEATADKVVDKKEEKKPAEGEATAAPAEKAGTAAQKAEPAPAPAPAPESEKAEAPPTPAPTPAPAPAPAAAPEA